MRAKKFLIVTHGLGEHSGRYQFLYNLVGLEYTVITYDLKGHGKDQRQHGTIDNFTSYREELKKNIDDVIAQNENCEIVLMGHSMGALITADFCKSYQALIYLKHIKKVLLSAPPMGVTDPLGRMIHALPFFLSSRLAKLPLHIPFKGAINPNFLSQDRNVVENYLQDPLNILAPSLKLLLSLIAHSKRVFGGSLDFLARYKVTIIVGELDKIVDVKKIRELSDSVTLIEIADGFHELHNEIEPIRSNYFKELLTFLKE